MNFRLEKAVSASYPRRRTGKCKHIPRGKPSGTNPYFKLDNLLDICQVWCGNYFRIRCNIQQKIVSLTWNWWGHYLWGKTRENACASSYVLAVLAANCDDFFIGFTSTRNVENCDSIFAGFDAVRIQMGCGMRRNSVVMLWFNYEGDTMIGIIFLLKCLTNWRLRIIFKLRR